MSKEYDDEPELIQKYLRIKLSPRYDSDPISAEFVIQLPHSYMHQNSSMPHSITWRFEASLPDGYRVPDNVGDPETPWYPYAAQYDSATHRVVEREQGNYINATALFAFAEMEIKNWRQTGVVGACTRVDE